MNSVLGAGFLFAVICAVSSALNVGKFHPLTPSFEEMEICKNNANGKEILLIYKKLWHNCYIQCWYKGESRAQAFLTPKGMPCCDIGGATVPTGTCDNGRCVTFWAQLV